MRPIPKSTPKQRSNTCALWRRMFTLSFCHPLPFEVLASHIKTLDVTKHNKVSVACDKKETCGKKEEELTTRTLTVTKALGPQPHHHQRWSTVHLRATHTDDFSTAESFDTLFYNPKIMCDHFVLNCLHMNKLKRRCVYPCVVVGVTCSTYCL